MRKMYYLMLLLLISIVSMNAQVTIGSQDTPHDGAVLELKSNDNRGFLLPKVALTSASIWSPIEGIPIDGMLVYNTSVSITDGLRGTGIYVWSNQSWMKITFNLSQDAIVIPEYLFLNMASAELPVGDILNLLPTVFPSHSTDKSVLWTSDNTSVATISEAGVVTAVYPGIATITATTNSGGVKATCIITVPVYKDVLKLAVELSLGLMNKEDQYVEAGFPEFKNAFYEAVTVLTSKSVTQPQVDLVYETLMSRMLKLRLKAPGK